MDQTTDNQTPNGPARGCPAIEDIAALAEGRLAGADRERVIAHVADCSECRELLAATMHTLEELEGEAGATVHAFGEAAGRAAQARGRRPWAIPLLAAAACLIAVSSLVVHQMGAMRRVPPSRDAWLAEMPPAETLVPSLWGGTVMRGEGESGTITHQSGEIGALLVDLEVALAAGDGARAGELARRMAAILDDAGLMDEEVAALRAAAGRDAAAATGTLRAWLPQLEERLRQRFLPFYLDLGTFAEEARVAALSGESRFFEERATRRYVDWLLEQRKEPLPPVVRESLQALRQPVASPDARSAAATAILRALTS
jgi:hypothetical protein